MTNKIDGNVLKFLRKGRGLTQTDLAEKSGVDKDSIARIERGKQSGTRPLTQKNLAEALAVAPTDLTGAKKVSQESGTQSDERLNAWPLGSRHKITVRVDGAVRNALRLVELRYDIPAVRILELAPLLFMQAAERSLQKRRVSLSAVKEGLSQATTAAANLHHLPPSIAPEYEAEETIYQEERSIGRRDILAEHLTDAIFERISGEDFREKKHDYALDRDNPFVESLREEAAAVGNSEIETFWRHGTSFSVCRFDALALASGDEDIADDILAGSVLIHEMPRHLLKEAAADERLAWLRAKADEHAAAMRKWISDNPVELIDLSTDPETAS